MTNPSKHLLAIRDGKRIDTTDIVEQRDAFREACRAMRKWLSPVLKPAASWFDRVDKLRLLCRLESDDRIVVELLAARLAAQVTSYAAPGAYDDLILAAGLQIVPDGTIVGDDVGAGVRISDAVEGEITGCRVIVLGGLSLVLKGARISGVTVAANRIEAADAIDALAERNTGGMATIELDYGPASAYEGMLFDTVHDPWHATKVYSDKLKAHPNQIIEPATLAATEYPEPTYRPLLPAMALERGLISDVQFEAIVYGLQATDSYLPGSPSGREWAKAPRGGFIVGDGTGVGKSNIACGMILDQWNRGSKRHIIVVERENHHRHVQEAWEMLGGKPREIVWHGDYAAKDELPDRDVVIVTSYALIRNDDRYESILSWARQSAEFHGFLIFDEAQNMRNAIEDVHDEVGGWGNNQSQQGMRGVQIQEDLPDARVAYMSATMATDVFNLGYAPRLGLWGQDAPFADISHFLGAMKDLDEAGLEQVCIDLKAAGRYCSRSLSFDGVEYAEVEHKMTPKQRASFDAIVRGWREIGKIMEEAAKLCGGGKPPAQIAMERKTNRTNQQHMKRLAVEQALSAFAADSLIEDIHKEIAAGNAPVVQIAMTGAARLQKIAAGRNYVPEDDFFDKEILRLIEESMNIHDVVMVPAHGKDGKPLLKIDGSPMTTPAYLVDDEGNRIENPEAMALRNKAEKLTRELSARHGVLDRLYEAFPASMIAEMTGRQHRALPVKKNGTTIGWDIVERGPSDKDDDVDAFLRGDKKILVFSLGAGGSGRSYHASATCKNQDRRVHYLVELGQRADQSVQGMGRTHRSGQVVPPMVKIVRCDIPAQMIYASRTLEKISKLGALSSGHQQSKTNAILEQRIPLRGKYAQEGWRRTVTDVLAAKIPPITQKSMMEDFDLKPKKTIGIGKQARLMTHSEQEAAQKVSKDKLYNVELMIKKIALMVDGDQRALVDALIKHTDDVVAEAIRKGEYNQGLETIRSSSIKIVDERKVRNANGAATTYIRLRRQDEVKPILFFKASMMATAARRKRESSALFLKHRVSGRVILAITSDRATGIVETYSPRGSDTRSIEMLRHEPWRLIEDLFEAEKLWNLEKERLDMKGVSDLHMLTGSLLYNWDKLPQGGIGLQRCRTDDGRVIVGRIIQQPVLRSTLQKLGIESGYKPLQITMMLSKVDQGAQIAIDNGWSIVAPTQPHGDYRLLVPDEEQTGMQRAEMQKIGILVIDTPLGHELEIPRANAVAIIQQLSVGSELTVSGVATVQAPASAPVVVNMIALPLAACS